MRFFTILIGVLIAGIILIGGLWIWSNQTIWGPKGICGPKGMGTNYDTSYCDRSCITDDDCKFTCGCGAINKNEICHDEGIIYGCVGHETKCEKSKCVIGEEILPAEVTIITDKAEYLQGETVKITVFNGLMEDIFVIDSGYPYSARLERRNKSGEWEKVELLVIATKLMSKLLKPGEKHIYSWNQRIGNSSIAEPGIYRLGIYVYDGKEELYYSNEFTIKEKENLSLILR